MAHEADKWVTGVRVETEKFMEDLACAFQQASSIMARMEAVDHAWGDASVYQSRVIQRLEALRRTPLWMLIDGGVIQESDRYEFSRWYSSVVTGRFFDVAQADSARVRKAMENIIDGVQNNLEVIFARRLNPDEVTTNNLRGRLVPFFSEVKTFVLDDFENTSTFSSLI